MTNSPEAFQSTRRGIYAVVVLCLALVLSFIDRFTINLVVDPIRAELRLSDVAISFLQGAGFALFFGLAVFPAGRLADRFNRPKLIATGVAIWSLATIACGLSPDFWSFLISRLFVGLGEATLIPAASSFIVDSFSPRHRGSALGVFSLGSTSGAGVAMILGGAVLAYLEATRSSPILHLEALSPWRKLMISMGVPGFLLIPLLLLIRDPYRGRRFRNFNRPALFRHLIANSGFVLRLCMAKGVMSVADYGIVAWLPTLLLRDYSATYAEAGAIVGLAVALPGMVGAVVGGSLSDWIARRYGLAARPILILACYAIATIGALAFFFASTSMQLGLAFSIWGLGSVSGYVVGQVAMQENVPSEIRATTVALSISVTALVGIGCGPTLIPILASNADGSIQSAMTVVAVAAAVTASIILGSAVRTARR